MFRTFLCVNFFVKHIEISYKVLKKVLCTSYFHSVEQGVVSTANIGSLQDYYTLHPVGRQFRSLPRSQLQYKFQGGSFVGVFSGF